MSQCKEPTHWIRPWCWERCKAKGEEDGREWNGYIATLINGHKHEQTLGDSGGQGSLACCNLWGLQKVRRNWTTVQIKATVRHHYIPNLLLKNTIPHPDEVEEVELILCWRECKMVQPRWKIAAQFLKHILNTRSYLPKDKVCMKSSIWMFIVALFVITQSWQQLTCPSIGKWINDYSYNEILLSNKKQFTIWYTTLIHLKMLMLSERQKMYAFIYIEF